MRLTIVTVTHNSSHVLPSFLESLNLDQVGESAHLVLVDSGSDDPSAVRSAALACGAHFIDAQANVGYGSASNIGAIGAESEWIAFVNPDVSVAAQDLLRLCGAAEANGLAAIGPTILLPGGGTETNVRSLIVPPWRRRTRRTLVKATPLSEDILRCASVSGCCLVVETEAFASVGGFDPRFFMFAEEIDLQARLGKRGHVIGMSSSVFVESPGGASSEGVTPRWGNTQRLASHVLYVDKHFTRLEGLVDLGWRTLQVLSDRRYFPRRTSLRQLFAEVRAGMHRRKGRSFWRDLGHRRSSAGFRD